MVCKLSLVRPSPNTAVIMTMEATKKCNRCVKSHTEAVAAAEAEEKRVKQAFDSKLAAHKRSEMTEPRVTIKIDARTIISVKRAVVERYGGTEAYAEHYRKRLSQFNPY